MSQFNWLDFLCWLGALIVGISTIIGAIYAARYFHFAKEQHDAEKAEQAQRSPFLRVSYHRTASDGSNGSVIVAFVNAGNGPVQWFTADIKSNGGTFQVGHANRVTTSGKGGSWTIVSGKNLLPQEKATVLLSFVDPNTTLNPPEIKSDSRYEFVGERVMTIGPFVRVENGGFSE